MNSNVKLLTALNDGKLDELKDMLKENIREESAKGLGKKKQFTIINSIMTKAAKEPRLQANTYIPFGDKYAFTDGRVTIFSDETFGFEMSRSFLDFRSFLPQSFISSKTVQLEEAYVKTFLDLNKTVKDVEDLIPILIKDTETGCLLGLDPRYVANIMQFAPVAAFKYIPERINGRCITSPIFAVNEAEELIGMIFPIQITDQMLEKYMSNPDIELVSDEITIDDVSLER